MSTVDGSQQKPFVKILVAFRSRSWTDDLEPGSLSKPGVLEAMSCVQTPNQHLRKVFHSPNVT